MKVYVASSWRNTLQPGVVQALRTDGHTVYDFRNPSPGNNGFHWSEIDPDWLNWTPGRFRSYLNTHPLCEAGFEADMNALMEANACVLVLPCGRSAHLELGWAQGAGKITVALMLDPSEPELMYRMLGRVCTSVAELRQWLPLQWAEDTDGL